MITYTVTRTVARGIFANRSKALPPVRSKLLLTLRPYAYGEDVILDDIYGNIGEDVVVEWRERYGEDVPIVAYMIPESMQAEMFAKLGAGLWFDSAGTAKQVNCIELAQSPEINQWAVWYRLDAAAGLGNREVLFYDHDTLLYSEYIKISNYFRNTSGLYDAILYYDAEEDPDTELTGGPSTFNSSILGPQYERQSDGSYSVTDYNLIPNSEAVGGAVGVLPTGWVKGDSNGVVVSVVGAGIGYVDVSFVGTAVGIAYPFILSASNTAIVASPGETWTGSFPFDVISGSLSVLKVSLRWMTATGGGVSSIYGYEMSSSPITGTAPALTERVTVGIVLTIPSGSSVNVTIRISRPQLTKSSTQLPYKPTYGTSVATPAVDILEDGFVGLRSCGAVTNLIPNPEAVGASVGVLPTGWVKNDGNGIAVSVVGFGTGYVDVKFVGTATVQTYPEITFATGISAVTGEILNSRCNISFLQGSYGSLRLSLSEYSPTYLRETNAIFPSSELTTTLGASTTTVRSRIYALVTVGTTVDFTIRISRPQLTKSSYPQPYCVGTQSASNATTTGGNWFTNPDGSPLWQSLTGAPLTLATRIKMGVGSGDLNLGTFGVCSASSNLSPAYINRDATLGVRWPRSFDGVTVAQPASHPSWSRGAIFNAFVQVITAGTQFRVGYMIEGTHTTIQWGSWAAYDGSFNPSTIYRLMLGYNNPQPMWLNKLAVWKRQVSDAELLEVFS